MPKGAKWNEIACIRCKEPISPSASKCPHCHADFTPEEIAGQQKSHRSSLAFGCGLLVIFILALSYCAVQDDEEDENQSLETQLEPADDRSAVEMMFSPQEIGAGKHCLRGPQDTYFDFPAIVKFEFDIDSWNALETAVGPVADDGFRPVRTLFEVPEKVGPMRYEWTARFDSKECNLDFGTSKFRQRPD